MTCYKNSPSDMQRDTGSSPESSCSMSQTRSQSRAMFHSSAPSSLVRSILFVAPFFGLSVFLSVVVFGLVAFILSHFLLSIIFVILA